MSAPAGAAFLRSFRAENTVFQPRARNFCGTASVFRTQ